VAIAYRMKERLRDFYATTDPAEALSMLEELVTHRVKRTMPPEIQKLGRTIRSWFDKIVNFHIARVSNGPTESLNNLIKRIKRIGLGSATSRTTASGRCSTPASPTGASWAQSSSGEDPQTPSGSEEPNYQFRGMKFLRLSELQMVLPIILPNLPVHWDGQDGQDAPQRIAAMPGSIRQRGENSWN
jgi:hypothetical protein